MKRSITILENNVSYSSRYMGEPQLGRRGLYSTLGTDKLEQGFKTMRDVLAYCDGTNTLLDLGNRLKKPAWELIPYIEELEQNELIYATDSTHAGNAMARGWTEGRGHGADPQQLCAGPSRIRALPLRTCCIASWKP